jgi:selenocysteine lyase/cysteine desulfurase
MNREADGIRVRVVAPAGGRDVDVAALAAAVSPQTRAICISHVAWITGYRIDLPALGELCRERGLFLVVDGAQSVGAIDFRVTESPIDVLAVSGYKWLLGPYGTGFTYVSPRVLDRMTVGDVNWFSVEGAAHLSRPAPLQLKFRDGARRFDIAETASFLNLSGLAASIEFLNRARVPTIEAHVRRLLDRLLDGIGRTALRVVSNPEAKHRSSILTLEGASLDATRTRFRRLKERGVIVSLRGNLIRVSPNIYNTPDDIAALLEAAR